MPPREVGPKQENQGKAALPTTSKNTDETNDFPHPVPKPMLKEGKTILLQLDKPMNTLAKVVSDMLISWVFNPVL